MRWLGVRLVGVVGVVGVVGWGVAGCDDGAVELETCFDGQLRPLTVVVDPTLGPPGDLSYDCDGDADWGDGACIGEVPTPVVATIDGDVNVALRKMGLFGWWPMVELTEDAGGRVCGVHDSDVSETTCEPPVCATGGTVTLSRFPAAPSTEPVHVRLDVSFGGGARMRAGFTIEEVR